MLAPATFIMLTALSQSPPFGAALSPPAQVEPKPAYARPPLTLDLWARLDRADRFNILVAFSAKESPLHWELYTAAGSGKLAAFLPGSTPAIHTSDSTVTDGRWHFLSMIYEPARIRLYVDGKLVLDNPLAWQADPAAEPGPLWIGAYPPQSIGCDGVIDDVHLRRGVHVCEEVPNQPADRTADTLALWSFDSLRDGAYADASALQNPTRPGVQLPLPPEFQTGHPPSYRAAEPGLKVVLVDRSVDASFIAVRLDSTGRIFVGGRQDLFVLEPNPDGSYQPRSLLYRFPDHSWIGDIAIRGDDLYIATSSAIYRLPHARTQRKDLEPERLVWGTPVDLHVTYHGLAFGPQGDLFFNSGDPLLNHGDFSRPDHWGHWTVFHGPSPQSSTPYTGVGAVFRMNPDGTHLRAIAGGLRGSDGVCFDSSWNLFTNDNDHESIPERYTPYRLLHVTPNADFAWPRGWAARRSPDRADLLDPINPGLGRGVPVGQDFYGDAFLPESFRNALLVAQWGHRSIQAHRLVPAGSTFTTAETPLLIGEGRARPVGVAVGRGGRVFATIAYMAQNEGSPTYPSDLVMITRSDDPASAPFESIDLPKVDSARVWAALSARDWSQRDAAHQELLRRGGPALDDAITRLAATSAEDPAFLHMIWLAAASQQHAAEQALRTLAKHENSTIQLQALRALADFKSFSYPHIEPADPLQLLATIEAFSNRGQAPPDLLVRLAAHAGDRPILLAAAVQLARSARTESLASLLESADAQLRLLATIAVGRRLSVPAPHRPLPDNLPLTYTSQNALFKVDYAGESVDLKSIGRVGSFTTADLWRIAPRDPSLEAAFNLLLSRLEDAEPRVRLQAAYFLSLLDDPRANPRIAEVLDSAARQRLASAPRQPIERIWLIGPLDVHPARAIESQGAIDLSSKHDQAAWAEAASQSGEYALAPADDRVSLAYFRLQSQSAQPVYVHVRSDRAVSIFLNGRPAYENEIGVIRGFTNTARIDLHAGTNNLLVRFQHDQVPSQVALALQAPPEVSVELPERLDIASLAERLKSGNDPGRTIPAAFLEVDWSAALRQADPERGRRLFGIDGIGCAKCHPLDPNQPGAGAPSLAEASQRFTLDQLVESVLAPGRQVAPIFRGTVIATRDGQVLSGLVTNETAGEVELLQTDATRVHIPLGNIEERRPLDGSPMPSGLVQTPDELRDILAFLLGHKGE